MYRTALCGLRKRCASKIADSVSKITGQAVGDEARLAIALSLKYPENLRKASSPHYHLSVPTLKSICKLDDESANKLFSRLHLDFLGADVDDGAVQLLSEGGTARLGFYLPIEPFNKAVLTSILEEGKRYGLQSVLHQAALEEDGRPVPVPQNQKVVVEFSSPNIAKPFHAGHLRSTILGRFVSSLNQALGHQVVKITYLGDWGTQFGLLCIGYEKYGSEEKLKENPMRHLYEVYVKINQDAEANPEIQEQGKAYFRRIEDGEEQAVSLWKHFRDLSIKSFVDTYKRLNIEFDEYSSESLYSDKAKSIVEQLRQKGLLDESESSQAAVMKLPGSKEGEDRKITLLKSDGSTLYLSRDLAAAIDRYERFSFDRIHYVVGSEQASHFSNILQILQRLGHHWTEQCASGFHIDFGAVKGMKTRKGTAVFLEDILDEAKAVALQKLQDTETTKVKPEDVESTAEALGISAVVIQDFKTLRKNAYEFDWDKMVDFKGDSGLFLQYCHARLCSLEREARRAGVAVHDDIDFTKCGQKKQFGGAKNLVIMLAKYEEVIRKSFVTLEPTVMYHYLLELCVKTNSLYLKYKVVGMPLEIAESRLLLFHCARVVLGQGLELLGLTPLEEM